jgi:hypothetical protein
MTDIFQFFTWAADCTKEVLLLFLRARLAKAGDGHRRWRWSVFWKALFQHKSLKMEPKCCSEMTALQRVVTKLFQPAATALCTRCRHCLWRLCILAFSVQMGFSFHHGQSFALHEIWFDIQGVQLTCPPPRACHSPSFIAPAAAITQFFCASFHDFFCSFTVAVTGEAPLIPPLLHMHPLHLTLNATGHERCPCP